MENLDLLITYEYKPICICYQYTAQISDSQMYHGSLLAMGQVYVLAK